jgi:hypothetical protein
LSHTAACIIQLLLYQQNTASIFVLATLGRLSVAHFTLKQTLKTGATTNSCCSWVVIPCCVAPVAFMKFSTVLADFHRQKPQRSPTGTAYAAITSTHTQQQKHSEQRHSVLLCYIGSGLTIAAAGVQDERRAWCGVGTSPPHTVFVR